MNQGFSYFEMLIVLFVLFVVGGSLSSTLNQGQEVYAAEKNRSQDTHQARVALDIIASYLRQAGNDPYRYLDLNDIPAVEYDPEAQELRMRSDITGSDASTTSNPAESTGDPDGSLDSIHEDVTVALQGSDLTLDIGYGPEVLARDIASLSLSFFDRVGQSTDQPNAAARSTLTLVTQNGLIVKTDVFLRRSSLSMLFR